MAEQQNEKGISRIDSGSTHGWFVRGYRNGKTYSRLFSDRKCGGRDEAWQAALSYRDELYSNLEKIPSKPRERRMVYRDSRNTTGILGVSRTRKKDAQGRVSECYSVSWRPKPGQQKCTSFSIRKYGEKKAFDLAVSLRKQKLREIYGPSVIRRINQRARKKGEKSML
ncbi:hypothetical protein [Ruficoccus sp. ZRK36]|uniref:hypothetical protein n=1 Tax=Ruficoccus sp. ZRK36 TaxID=2866311 RepID=UPI001C72B890|nr:hypothetical protein [Ruficoccus sp. ZRK36]QYY34681.1 hypothetical protein K0V07_10240 [Ruficoccus sp. ZRK36]